MCNRVWMGERGWWSVEWSIMWGPLSEPRRERERERERSRSETVRARAYSLSGVVETEEQNLGIL